MKHLSKNGDASKFIDHVFRAFDEDRNGYIDITEYIMGSYLASEKSTLDEKLSFAFKLYDIGNNCFNLNICTSNLKLFLKRW